MHGSLFPVLSFFRKWRIENRSFDSKNYPSFVPESLNFPFDNEIDRTTGLTVVNDSLDVLFESRRNLGILESSDD